MSLYLQTWDLAIRALDMAVALRQPPKEWTCRGLVSFLFSFKPIGSLCAEHIGCTAKRFFLQMTLYKGVKSIMAFSEIYWFGIHAVREMDHRASALCAQRLPPSNQTITSPLITSSVLE